MEPQQAERFVFKSRTFSGADLALILEIVDSYSHLGRYEIGARPVVTAVTPAK